METKRCSTCHVYLPLTQFNKRSRAADGPTAASRLEAILAG